jgi:hypothetical protein
VLVTDTDLDRPNPDWHVLDADPDPAKCCGSEPIRILSHNTAANTAKLLICLSVLHATASPILAGSSGGGGGGYGADSKDNNNARSSIPNLILWI